MKVIIEKQVSDTDCLIGANKVTTLDLDKNIKWTSLLDIVIPELVLDYRMTKERFLEWAEDYAEDKLD